MNKEQTPKEETVRHQLKYDMHSCRVSWCSICHKHFYNERNQEHTTIATPKHYHEIILKETRPETLQEAFENFDDVSKRFGGNPSSHRTYFAAGAEWQSNQQQQQGVRWVKAIDQLPSRGEKVFWRRTDGKNIYTGYDSFDNIKYMELPEIEWLLEL